jgi:Prokaryotic homologs of the JAB domain
VSDFDSEIFDRALAEIVGNTPLPRSARGGWSLRSRTPLIELDDLSPDWWAARARFRRTPTSMRSPRPAQRRRRPNCSVSRVDLTPRARAAIRRELARDWDGREQGGALVGRIIGETVVIEDAGGLGVGVSTARGNSWFRPPLARFHDFARACGCDLVGDWHSHRESPAASTADRDGWERVRVALEATAYVGVVVAPMRAFALGLRPSMDTTIWSWADPEIAAYLVTKDGCELVGLT